jgi:hypothetical protein
MTQRRFQVAQKSLVKRDGERGGRGFVERGPGAFAGGGVERELAHHEDPAIDLADRAVHFSGLIGEEADRRDLGGQPGGIGRRVVAVDTEEDQQARADLSGHPIPHAHAGGGDPLHEGAHGGWAEGGRMKVEG